MASHDLRPNSTIKSLESVLDHSLSIFELLTMSDHGLDEAPPHVFNLTADSGMVKGLRLLARVGGEAGAQKDFMVDTGSAGIVVSKEFLGLDVVDTGLPFELVYSSSGETFTGTWVIAPVTLYSASPSPSTGIVTEVTTAHMLIRKVDKGSEVYMMGVGFDRSKPLDPGHNHIPLNLNPFLMLPEMLNGSMKPGYILTSKTITLGITEENSSDFTFIGLEPKPDLSDWVAPIVQVTFQNGPNSFSFSASLLVDTGLNRAYITGPQDNHVPSDSKHHLAPGAKITVTSEEDNVTLYDFTVIDTKEGEIESNQESPDWVEWSYLTPSLILFVNTSRYALTQFDYLFDSQWGRVGFRFLKAGDA